MIWFNSKAKTLLAKDNLNLLILLQSFNTVRTKLHALILLNIWLESAEGFLCSFLPALSCNAAPVRALPPKDDSLAAILTNISHRKCIIIYKC